MLWVFVVRTLACCSHILEMSSIHTGEQINIFSGFSLLSLERSSLAVFPGVQDVVHLVSHVSIKWGVALLVHHFAVRQHLIESQPLVDFSSNYSVYARSLPTSSPGCFSLALEVGRPTSKAREKDPGKEVGSWHCKLILLYSEAGFSVAFGSTGCAGSDGRRAPFAPLPRTLSCGGTNS